MTTALERLVGALEDKGCRPVQRGDRWEFFCPSHADGKNRAGEARQGNKGAVLCCHGPCSQGELFAALGLDPASLFDEAPKPRLDWSRPDAVYRYRTMDGTLLYEVRRIGYGHDKEIRPHKPDGTMGMPPCERVLYRLDEVAAQVGTTAIAVVEGERDVDAAWAAGIAATTNVGGAGKWRDAYSTQLAGMGAQLIVVADDDDAGHRHARSVVASLLAAGADVDTDIRLAAEGNDLVDHLAAGLGPADLRVLGRPAKQWSSILVAFSALVPRSVEWWWDQRWPLGKIVVLDGDPGLGKSLLTLDLAARASNGRHAPDGTMLLGGPTMLMTAEDDAEDTILPRYLAAGGRVEHLFAFSARVDGEGQRPPILPVDISEIEDRMVDLGARLLVIDPIMEYLDSNTDSHKDQDIRRVLRQLSIMAARTRSCVLLVRHLNKSGGGSAIYRGGGSIGIVGAARAGWVVGKDPNDESRRVLAPTKNNLAASDASTSLAFRIISGQMGAQIVWEGAVNITADQLMERPAEPSKLEMAATWLEDFLADGARPATEVYDTGQRAGFSQSMLRRAAAEHLGFKPQRISVGNAGAGAWMWELPRD